MPKMKSNSGAKKRFRLTAKGKVKFRRAFRNHILTKRAPRENVSCVAKKPWLKQIPSR